MQDLKKNQILHFLFFLFLFGIRVQIINQRFDQLLFHIDIKTQKTDKGKCF